MKIIPDKDQPEYVENLINPYEDSTKLHKVIHSAKKIARKKIAGGLWIAASLGGSLTLTVNHAMSEHGEHISANIAQKTKDAAAIIKKDGYVYMGKAKADMTVSSSVDNSIVYMQSEQQKAALEKITSFSEAKSRITELCEKGTPFKSDWKDTAIFYGSLIGLCVAGIAGRYGLAEWDDNLSIKQDRNYYEWENKHNRYETYDI